MLKHANLRYRTNEEEDGEERQQEEGEDGESERKRDVSSGPWNKKAQAQGTVILNKQNIHKTNKQNNKHGISIDEEDYACYNYVLPLMIRYFFICMPAITALFHVAYIRIKDAFP